MSRFSYTGFGIDAHDKDGQPRKVLNSKGKLVNAKYDRDGFDPDGYDGRGYNNAGMNQRCAAARLRRHHVPRLFGAGAVVRVPDAPASSGAHVPVFRRG